MDNIIIDTREIAEQNWDPSTEPGEVSSSIQATEGLTTDRLQFHVQMTGYTLEDMDALIVEAAARQIVGKRTDTVIAKEIEAKCAEMITRRIDATLVSVTAEIIDQPVTPNWGDKKPVTMREMIGLMGREYLTKQVTRDGKETSSSYETWGTRVEWIVWQKMSTQFKNEIEKATGSAIAEMQRQVKAAQESLIIEQKKRLSEALAKLTS